MAKFSAKAFKPRPKAAPSNSRSKSWPSLSGRNGETLLHDGFLRGHPVPVPLVEPKANSYRLKSTGGQEGQETNAGRDQKAATARPIARRKKAR
jgi:hypothetical protein